MKKTHKIIAFTYTRFNINVWIHLHIGTRTLLDPNKCKV